MPKKYGRLPWNWKSRIETIFREEKNYFEFIIQFKDGKEIDGFDKEIGVLSVDKEEPYFVAVVQLEESFRGRGLGKGLYISAIKKIGKLSTKYSEASSLAKNVWKSLIKDFSYKTDFWEGRLTVYNKKSRRGQKS